MSENCVTNSSKQSEQAKGYAMPGIKPVPQRSFNGLASQDSSRGSSPSLYATNMPASQLPSARIIPASQLPPVSTISSVTQKISQLSVQNQLLSNVSKPQYTSTPNKTTGFQNEDLLANVSTKTEEKTNLVQQNFHEVPLNDEKSVSITSHLSTDIFSGSQVRTNNNGTRHQEAPKPIDSHVSDSRGSQMPLTNFNNQLFQKQSNNMNIGTIKQVQQFPYSQTSINAIKPEQIQNQKQYSSQSQNSYNSVSSQFQTMQTGPYMATTQPNSSVTTSIAGQLGQPIASMGTTTQKLDSFNNIIGQNINRDKLSTTPLSQASPVHMNRTSSMNFPHSSMGNTGLAQNIAPTMTRQNFNLNAMGGQLQTNTQLTSQGSGGMPAIPNILQSHHSTTAGMAPQLHEPSKYPANSVDPYKRLPSTNQVLPPSPQGGSQNVMKTGLHANRYPTIPAQRVPSLPNLQPTYNQQYQSQSLQNQQYNVNPSANYSQSNSNQYNNQLSGHNVIHQGFNKLWGAEYYDLLQTANILPPTKILPPQVILANETLNLANCSGEIFRSTISKIPESQSLLQKSRLPLGILIHPFKDLTQLSVIQCNVIVRCRACRTYINPFVMFVDSKRWKCNLCYRVNDLPEEFQYDPVSKTYGDPSRRPEIKSSTIEYIAPAEYMLRPPQPAVYLFLLDVSRAATESGYLNLFCSVLQEELINLPGDSRTQVGFITYNSCLHFFMFADGLSQPHEMTVLDIDDVFLPSPDNLLVNLKDRLELIRDLLNQLPTRYNNTYDNNSALGAALQAAHRMMSATGGRVTVFQASLPNVGPGALIAREDPNQRASAEVHNLKPANDFYKRLALDCSSQQIAVDLFIVNSQYVDIATISGISRFSGGCIHHFPLFKQGRPLVTEKLEKCLRRYITRKIGFEAVMRIRCTRGMSIHTFHGNFFVRSTDLLSLPNVNPDAGYGMQVSIDENLSDVESVCFQAALLYTSSKGERRIRVHTLCLPVVSTLHDVINSADQQCIIGLLAKMAVDRSIESSLSDAREAFINVAIDILSSYKLSLNLGSTPNGLLAPNCLRLLPLYISALLKNQAFRTGTSTRLDDRVKAMIDMKTMPLPWLIKTIYPDLYPVHNLEEQQVILSVEEEPIYMPPHIQLTSRLIDNIGAYLMDTGDHMMLYVCSGASEVFLREGLGVPNFSCLNDQMYDVPTLENQVNKRLVSFINYLNEEKPYRATLQIIKDNSPIRGVFLERLIEDRVENALSYHEFLQHVKAQVK